MVDGDEYLIELVKARPALWNKDHDDYKNVEFKKYLWTEIADKITGSEKEFLRRRWTNLREKFVRVLRYNEVYASNFKYYSNMLFLKKHIQLRGVTAPSQQSESELSDQFLYVDDEPCHSDEMVNPKVEVIESTGQDDVEQQSSNESEDFEFTITDEIINQNSDTEEVIFVELNSDEEENSMAPTTQDSFNNSSNTTMTQITEKRKHENCESNISSTVDVTNKKLRSSCDTFDSGISSNGSRSHSQSDQRQFINNTQHKINGQCLENRCEDQIFGELVTAMLLKMDPDAKRKIKKEIMNVLLQ